MAIEMHLEADTLSELGEAVSKLAKTLGAGTVTPLDEVDPRILMEVLSAWAKPLGGDIRIIRAPKRGHGRTGRPSYLTVEELVKAIDNNQPVDVFPRTMPGVY
jgi:hypothetical protein